MPNVDKLATHECRKKVYRWRLGGEALVVQHPIILAEKIYRDILAVWPNFMLPDRSLINEK